MQIYTYVYVYMFIYIYIYARTSIYGMYFFVQSIVGNPLWKGSLSSPSAGLRS